MIREYINFEEIPSNQTCVKFKEFLYDQITNKHIETSGNTYYRINIDIVESIIIYDDNLVRVLGMTGKFFK